MKKIKLNVKIDRFSQLINSFQIWFMSAATLNTARPEWMPGQVISRFNCRVQLFLQPAKPFFKTVTASFSIKHLRSVGTTDSGSSKKPI